jgi:hypothetical protein
VTLDGAQDDIVFGGSLVTASTNALAEAVCEVMRPEN